VHVRSVVVEQLLRAGRKPDALPHLTVLHRLHAVAGRADEAEGVAQVAREIDDQWVPESDADRSRKRTDPYLVFIDSDDDFGALETSPMLGGDLERPAAATSSLEGLELTAPAAVEFDAMPTNGTLDGFEATSFEAPAEAAEAEQDSADEPAGLPEPTLSDEIEFLDVEVSSADAPAIPAPPAPPRLTPLSMPAVPPEPHAFSADLPTLDMSDDAEVSAFSSMESGTEVGGSLPGIGDAELMLDAVEEAPEPPAPVAPVAPAVPVTVAEPHRKKRPTPSYVNLSDILHEEEDSKSARMTIGEPKQTGDHEADFQHILQEFREGIEKTIPVEDADSHFDLGIAFREMGLIDDAIAEFQIASRSKLKRVESIEALGGCFLDKREPGVARNLLMRALDDPSVAHGDDRLRGVLYLLGLASEALGAREDGLRYYQRVYAVDIRFRDVAARIQTLQQPA
jgi:hypothetical protein